ncbi:MAG: DUF1501 domain-containing protein [Myxococcota bacterium]
MNLTRRSLLLSGAAATLVPRGSVRAADPAAPRFLIVLFANGGWDVTFAMDPKDRVEGGIDGPWVDQTANPLDLEERRVIHGIPVQCNDLKRKSVTSFFETWGHKACVVNGVWTGSIVHQPSRIRLLTGTQDARSPDFATIVGAAKGVSVDLPLGTIDFSGLGYTGPFAATTGRIGYSSQLKALLSDQTFRPPTWADYALPLYTPSSTEEEAIAAHLADRLAAFRAANADGARNDQRIDDIAESWVRRERLLDKADVIADRLELGGTPSLDLQADVAVDLLVGGVCHTVTLADTISTWDTHDLNALQHDQYQSFFTSLNRLCANLDAQGILDDTLVVVMSEMTRTPKRNWKTGKDHWAHTSQLWVGGGVPGGRVFGGTTDGVESRPVDLATGAVDDGFGDLAKYDNVVAGILARMGVDPGEFLPDVVPLQLG